MSELNFKLEEQQIEARSNQIVYKLIIENKTSNSVKITRLEAKVPIGAALLKVTDTSSTEASNQRNNLMKELNLLLDRFLILVNKDYAQAVLEQNKKIIEEIYSAQGFLKIVFKAITNVKYLEDFTKRQLAPLKYEISCLSDANTAYDKWIKDCTDYETIKKIFSAKVQQLEKIESLMNEEEKQALTIIPNESSFTQTYVIKFNRPWFEPRKYQFSVETNYQIGNSQKQNYLISTNVQISPYPLCLSLISIISALMGVFVNLAVICSSNKDLLNKFFDCPRIYVAPIIAVVFFNIYEQTAIGKNMKIPLSWRSAMLIGTLCGLSQDRIIASIKALVGL